MTTDFPQKPPYPSSISPPLKKTFPKAQQNKFCLSTVLVVPFILPIIVSTSLVGWLSSRNGQKAINDLVTQLNSEISSRIQQQVLEYLTKSQNTLQLNNAIVQSDNISLDDFEGLRRYFWQVVHKGDFEAYLSYGNERGEFVGVEYRENGDVQLKIRTQKTEPIREVYLLDSRGDREKLLKQSEYDPRTRPWYQAAVKAGQPTWSEIYPFFSRKNTALGISPVHPVFDSNGELQGVLCINILLTRITDFIEDLYISPRGQSFIMERSGNLVVSSEIPQPFKVFGEGDDRDIERIAAPKSKNATIAATAQHLQQHFGSFAAIDQSQQLKIKIGNELHYVRVALIQDGNGINWLAVVIVPENDFMAKINANTRTTILLCILTFLLATAIGILMARTIANPILRLTQASKELADGHLERRVETKDLVDIDEIETLEQSFNSMAGQLQEIFETLEDKVEERTAELATANEAISVLNERLKEENLRLSAEVDVARQIQNMILPKPEELDVEGLDIAGYMEPADEVGGDYYDVLHADGVLTIGIGDVTGHGLESGLLMLMTQTAVRTLKEGRERDPVKFLDTLNRTIYKNVERMNSDRNLTLAILNYSEGALSISGQHEETLVVRRGGEIERIDTMDLGLPIGLDDDIADFISHTSVELHPGDGVVVYTDGIPEAKNMDKEQYGIERLCEAISENWDKSAQAIKEAIVTDVRRFIGEQKVFDDITLLVLKQELRGSESSNSPSSAIATKFTQKNCR